MNYKGFHQLQWEDRLVIEKMLKVGDSKAKIAEALGVCKKTIYNEIKRGWTQQMTSDYEFIWCYCQEMAERKYQENLRAKGPDLKIGNDIDFANYVEQKIVEEHYSPAALLAELKAKPPQFDTTVCEATLYNYIFVTLQSALTASPISNAPNSSMQCAYWSCGIGNGMVATPYSGWLGLPRTA